MNIEDLPKTVERTRQYRDYEIAVLSHTEYNDEVKRVVRIVEAQATVDDQTVVAGDLREAASLPGIIQKIICAIKGTEPEPTIMITERKHVQKVLEDLHEKIKLVESRGSLDDPSDVDAAFDQVFGDGEDRYGDSYAD